MSAEPTSPPGAAFPPTHATGSSTRALGGGGGGGDEVARLLAPDATTSSPASRATRLRASSSSSQSSSRAAVETVSAAASTVTRVNEHVGLRIGTSKDAQGAQPSSRRRQGGPAHLARAAVGAGGDDGDEHTPTPRRLQERRRSKGRHRRALRRALSLRRSASTPKLTYFSDKRHGLVRIGQRVNFARNPFVPWGGEGDEWMRRGEGGDEEDEEDEELSAMQRAEQSRGSRTVVSRRKRLDGAVPFKRRSVRRLRADGDEDEEEEDDGDDEDEEDEFTRTPKRKTVEQLEALRVRGTRSEGRPRLPLFRRVRSLGDKAAMDASSSKLDFAVEEGEEHVDEVSPKEQPADEREPGPSPSIEYTRLAPVSPSPVGTQAVSGDEDLRPVSPSVVYSRLGSMTPTPASARSMSDGEGPPSPSLGATQAAADAMAAIAKQRTEPTSPGGASSTSSSGSVYGKRRSHPSPSMREHIRRSSHSSGTHGSPEREEPQAQSWVGSNDDDSAKWEALNRRFRATARPPQSAASPDPDADDVESEEDGRPPRMNVLLPAHLREGDVTLNSPSQAFASIQKENAGSPVVFAARKRRPQLNVSVGRAREQYKRKREAERQERHKRGSLIAVTVVGEGEAEAEAQSAEPVGASVLPSPASSDVKRAQHFLTATNVGMEVPVTPRTPRTPTTPATPSSGWRDSLNRFASILRSTGSIRSAWRSVQGKLVNAGPYVLRKKLGSGATCEVRQGKHMETKAKVAVKIIPQEHMKSLKLGPLIEREVDILSSVSHPHITRYIATYENEQHLFMVTELAGRGELFDYLVKHGACRREKALRLFAQLVDAVYYLHSNYVVHRDIKLENVFLSKNLNVKLGDFGFAKRMPENPRGWFTTSSCGSPHYASPELISGKPFNPFMSDVWALGVCLYAICTARMPFDAADQATILRVINRGKFTVPRSVDSDVEDLMRGMMHPNVEERLSLHEVRQHPCFMREDGTTYFEDIMRVRQSVTAPRDLDRVAAKGESVEPVIYPSPMLGSAAPPHSHSPMSDMSIGTPEHRDSRPASATVSISSSSSSSRRERLRANAARERATKAFFLSPTMAGAPVPLPRSAPGSKAEEPRMMPPMISLGTTAAPSAGPGLDVPAAAGPRPVSILDADPGPRPKQRGAGDGDGDV